MQNLREQRIQVDVKVSSLCFMQAVSVVRDKAGRRLDISISETIYGGMTKPELALAQETENLLAQQDITMEQTKDKKNALESYVYEMRNKVKIDISKIQIVIVPRYKEITKFLTQFALLCSKTYLIFRCTQGLQYISDASRTQY